MNPPGDTLIKSVQYTCTICFQTFSGLTRYNNHMQTHRTQPNSEIDATSHASSTASHSRHNHPQQTVFKKPTTPVSTRTKSKDKGKGKSTWHGGKEIIDLLDDDDSTRRGGKTGLAPPSQRSNGHNNHGMFSTIEPLAPNISSEAASLAERQHEITITSAKTRKRQRTTTADYRPISERAQEDARKLVHEAYIELMEARPNITDKEHNTLTTLMRKIDRQVKDTRIPKSTPKLWTGKGDIEEYIDTHTKKIDNILDETIRLEIENFYTKIETKKLGFVLERLEIEGQEIEEQIAAITGEDQGGDGDNELLAVPAYLRKYVSKDAPKSYVDYVMARKSSRFSNESYCPEPL